MRKRTLVLVTLFLIAVSGQPSAVGKADVVAAENVRNSHKELPKAESRKPRAIFDAQRAFELLKKQCEFGPRPPGSPAHRETQNYLFTELEKYANNVQLQPHQYKVNGITLQLNNILAEFGALGGETLLLAAHWDTRPFADRDPKRENQDKPILGANDGASGVAVLLEIARVLKQRPPPRRVIIVLFDGEDYGRSVDNMFIGSRFFAQNLGKWRPDYGILPGHGGRQGFEYPNRAVLLGGKS